ncbi:unnamed protein product [Closterium sp. NIES-64]|nr:unnamed protein product [Closterium sp. NIES-64]
MIRSRAVHRLLASSLSYRCLSVAAPCAGDSTAGSLLIQESPSTSGSIRSADKASSASPARKRNSSSSSSSSISASAGAMDRERFLGVFQQLKAELLGEDKLFSCTPDSKAWMEKNIDHNVPGGKLNRGLSVVDTVGILKGGFDKLSDDEVFKASAVGWCIEWLQAYFLVVDDIMDSSITRRGQPCWYRMDKVGMIAINDGVLLNSHIFLILRRHFSSHPAYTRLLDLFNEVTYQTACGQMLDLITTPEGEVDLNKYTMSTYLKIVQYKTAYYSFYLPVATALILAGVEDAALAAQAREILVMMGTYFQVQDDVLDCFGDPAVIGKVGTDIEDTKCSWLVVQALQRATQEQREIIESNYGKKDEKCVAVIKQLYTHMKLQDAFAEYEKESHAGITAAIAQVESEPLREALMSFLKKIYKRQK